jgi:predicted nucleotidyltransferase
MTSTTLERPERSPPPSQPDGRDIAFWNALLQLLQMTAEQLIREVWTIVSDELRAWPHALFLFGSRAQGSAGPFSDFDFAIDGASPIDRTRLARVRTRVDALPTLYSIDVVDYRAAGDDFRSVAGKIMRKVVDGRV